MNTTVARIVDLLFEDILESDEVRSIHDEVMNNCQERYRDLVADGYSEDEAIGAVVESLKGMDEVLRDYPRKNAADDPFRKDTGDAGCGPCTVSIAWDTVRELRISVRGADVEVAETEGGQTMELENGKFSWLNARVEGDVLVITQEDRDTPADTGRTGFFGALVKMFNIPASHLGDEGCRVSLGLPAGMLSKARIQSLSGDISFTTSAEEIDLQSASGDCTVSVPAGKSISGDGTDSASAPCRRIKAVSISGEIEIDGGFGTAEFTTTSGDIDFRGTAGALTATTVSGDISVDALTGRATANTVSGDIEMTLSGVNAAEVDLHTVSGDVELHVPDADKGVALQVKTRSGDVSYSGLTLSDGAPLLARVQTVSGDVEIHG